MTILVFILVLSTLVLVHELGHFLMAKKLGISVEEFGLGIPPRVFGKKIGETIYSINALPFGGFVRLYGEELNEKNEYPEKLLTDKRSFISKNPIQRASVLVAGVFMNFILAVTLFYIVLGSNKFETSFIPLLFDYDFRFGQEKVIKTVVTSVQTGSAAYLGGVNIGEAILKIDNIPVNSVEEVRAAIKDKYNNDVNLLLLDVQDPSGQSTRELKVRPLLDKDGFPVLGVYLTQAVSLSYLSPVEKLTSGFLHSYNVLSYSVAGLSNIISVSFKEKSVTPVSQSVSGPVGIFQIIGGVLDYGGSKILLIILDFVAVLSLSLAFINIMPFPALDGGRLVFVVFEFITNRKISPKYEAILHRIGMVFLLLLLLLVTLKDIFI